MNYVIRNNRLIETKTGNVIPVSGDAVSKMVYRQKHLNSGGGFNGQTPEFLLQRIVIKPDA